MRIGFKLLTVTPLLLCVSIACGGVKVTEKPRQTILFSGKDTKQWDMIHEDGWSIVEPVPNDQVMTLYRNSVTGPLRIHVATFDVDGGIQYNSENCQIAAELFRLQPGVAVFYWCERGYYAAEGPTYQERIDPESRIPSGA